MPSNLPPSSRVAIAQRNAEHGTIDFLQVNEDDLRELASGRVPEIVRRNAAWALETVPEMLVRKQQRNS